MSLDAKLYGTDLFGQPMTPPASGPIAERFGFPPFSVLDARSGDWQDRKRAWLRLGIKSEVGRGSSDLSSPGGSARPACDYSNRERGSGSGRAIAGTAAGRRDCNKLGFSAAATIKRHGVGFDGSKTLRGEEQEENGSGTSIFDPVLCEMAYRWFAPPGGQVVDPFAGGSVRGIVAGCLGRRYWGCDLRPEQIAANEIQADEIATDPRPEWIAGDSRETLAAAPDADLIFSCPPYGDLERYSDDPADLSAMEWPAFLDAYRAIIAAACERLRRDRFACFVVGDFRGKSGHYRNFVGETVQAFADTGLGYYNEAILVTAIGSLPIRIGKQFAGGRKLGKTHQNVLVFVKGDWKKAAAACGELE